LKSNKKETKSNLNANKDESSISANQKMNNDIGDEIAITGIEKEYRSQLRKTVLDHV